MKRRYIYALLVAFFVLVCLGVFLQPNPSYDLSKVHPRLRDLKTPYRLVASSYYLHLKGKTIEIKIVDRDNNTDSFMIYTPFGEANPFTQVYLDNPSKAKLVEITDPEHTKRMLICILSDYPHRTPCDDYHLLKLRRYTKDFIHVYLHKLYGDYEKYPPAID